MYIVKINGGLGNQMFQYAFAYTLSKKNKSNVKLDTEIFETYHLRKYELYLFNISLDLIPKNEFEQLKYKHKNIFNKILQKIKKKENFFSYLYYREAIFNFDKNIFKLQGDIYFDGYWQSEKYFNEYRDELLQHFTFKNKLSNQSKNYYQEILANESVSLHIRRGDYVSNLKTNSVHGLCSLEYYQFAISLLENKTIKPTFFIFSDDLIWAKENINFIDNLIFIELDKDTPDHEEMYLMSQCKHNIIANSSFSWWGAWLNQNKNKIVIAPKKWFNDISINTNDLIPESWIRL